MGGFLWFKQLRLEGSGSAFSPGGSGRFIRPPHDSIRSGRAGATRAYPEIVAALASSRSPERESGGRMGDYVKGQGPVLANLAEYLEPGEVDSIDAIEPGEGAVLRRGAAKHAVCRAEDGSIVERSAVCTHVGCIVHWNGFEKLLGLPLPGLTIST